MTIFLKFPDVGTFTSLLPEDFTPYGETGFPLPDGIEAISVIGVICQNDVLVNGWHVNALGTLPDNWKQYQIFPTFPQRTF